MKAMLTDPVCLDEAFVKVVNYLYKEEQRHFEETFSDYVCFSSQDSYKDAIETVEAIPGGTDHIFYSILILKAAYEELFDEYEESHPEK